MAFKFDTSAFLVERLDVTRVVTFSRGNMAAIYRSNKYKVTPLYSLKTEEGRLGHIFKDKILFFNFDNLSLLWHLGTKWPSKMILLYLHVDSITISLFVYVFFSLTNSVSETNPNKKSDTETSNACLR